MKVVWREIVIVTELIEEPEIEEMFGKRLSLFHKLQWDGGYEDTQLAP